MASFLRDDWVTNARVLVPRRAGAVCPNLGGVANLVDVPPKPGPSETHPRGAGKIGIGPLGSGPGGSSSGPRDAMNITAS